MADSSKTKSPKASKSRATAAKARSRAKKSGELGVAGDDADLRTRIAHRAYEISQSQNAGDDAENWLRAEREVRGE
jgi:hypothetical protein